MTWKTPLLIFIVALVSWELGKGDAYRKLRNERKMLQGCHQVLDQYKQKVQKLYGEIDKCQ